MADRYLKIDSREPIQAVMHHTCLLVGAVIKNFDLKRLQSKFGNSPSGVRLVRCF